MDDDLQLLTDAMTIKERLRLLAEIQASYLNELQQQGVDQSVAEQLMLDWSRHAYAMTTQRDRHAPSLDDEIDELLGTSASPRPSAAPSVGDPSSVPPGEPWLQLVEDVEQPAADAADEADDDASDTRRAA